MTIKKQLLYNILISILIPLLIIPWMGYLYIKETVKEQLLLQSRTQLEEITRNTENILDDILMVSNVIAADDFVINVLKEKEKNIKDQAEIIRMLGDVNAIYLYRYNAEICMYDNDGNVYSTLSSEFSENEEFRQEWRLETIENQAFFLWKAFSARSSESPVLGMSRSLYDQNGKRIGVLCLEIYQDRYLKKLLQQESDPNNTGRYLADEDGEFILSYTNSEKPLNFTEQIYQQLEMEGKDSISRELRIGTERYICIRDSVENTAWKTIQIVPYDEVFAKLNYYRNFTYISNLLGLALLIIISNYMTNEIGESLSHLGGAMMQVRKGNFITLENVERNIEMHQIYDDFNNMTTKLKELFEENQRITKEKEECRLLALQTQIQPHFLFNTLNGIKWLCIIESAPTAERMIESLGHILEYSLGNSKDCVTLEEEIECLKHYIELQKMRYGDIFDVLYDIDDCLNDLEVPVLCLQPLAENSIIHGVRENTERGKIIIHAKVIDSKPALIVEDNGAGMNKEKISQIMHKTPSEGNIGVMNVKERMELYYRDSSFQVISVEGHGTKIQIMLGARRE